MSEVQGANVNIKAAIMSERTGHVFYCAHCILSVWLTSLW
jgi:hypothetical protein